MTRRAILIIAIVVVALGIWFVAPSGAQTGGTYDLTWNSIDGGGATFATGGTYTLGGTIGQPDAGVLNGGTYTLVGGFWGALNTGGSTYMPVIAR